MKKTKLLERKLKNIILTNLTITQVKEKSVGKGSDWFGVLGPGYYTLDLAEGTATQLVEECLKTISSLKTIERQANEKD